MTRHENICHQLPLKRVALLTPIATVSVFASALAANIPESSIDSLETLGIQSPSSKVALINLANEKTLEETIVPTSHNLESNNDSVELLGIDTPQGEMMVIDLLHDAPIADSPAKEKLNDDNEFLLPKDFFKESSTDGDPDQADNTSNVEETPTDEIATASPSAPIDAPNSASSSSPTSQNRSLIDAIISMGNNSSSESDSDATDGNDEGAGSAPPAVIPSNSASASAETPESPARDTTPPQPQTSAETPQENDNSEPVYVYENSSPVVQETATPAESTNKTDFNQVIVDQGATVSLSDSSFVSFSANRSLERFNPNAQLNFSLVAPPFSNPLIPEPTVSMLFMISMGGLLSLRNRT